MSAIPMMDLAFKQHRIGVTKTGCQQTVRIKRARHCQRTRLCPGKSQRRIIGRITDQQHSLTSASLRRSKCNANQFAANSAVLVRRPHRQWTKQMPGNIPGEDRRHPHRGDGLTTISRNE